MNVIPFPGKFHYVHLDPEMEEAVRRMWSRRPKSRLNEYAPNVEWVLRELNEQARFAKLAEQG